MVHFPLWSCKYFLLCSTKINLSQSIILSSLFHTCWQLHPCRMGLVCTSDLFRWKGMNNRGPVRAVSLWFTCLNHSFIFVWILKNLNLQLFTSSYFQWMKGLRVEGTFARYFLAFPSLERFFDWSLFVKSV